MRYSKAFSSLVIAVMVFSMVFPPFAYAEEIAPEPQTTLDNNQETGTITVCSGTTINYITDADRQRLWESTIGFTADEINDLNPQQNALQEAGTFENPMYLAVAPEGAEKKVDFRSFATLMGVTGEDAMRDLALQLGVQIDRDNVISNDAEVLISRANLYAENQGKASVFMNKLAEWGLVEQGATQLPAASEPAYSELKISLPGGGNQIALSDLYKLEAMDPESCLLQDRINGRVTYMGLLAKDLTYGDDGEQIYSGRYESPASGGVDDELNDGSNQHFTGESITGYIDLGQGSNILIPSFYENWLKTFKTINNIQFAIGGLTLLTSSMHTKNLIAQQQKVEGNLQSIQGLDIGRSMESVFKSEVTLLDDAGDVILDATTGTPITKTFSTLSMDEVENLYASGNPVAVEYAGVAGVKGQITKFTSQLEEAQTIIGTWSRVKKLASPALTTSIVLGFTWLGPGRFMFEVNDGLLLETTSSQNGQYLTVVANRKPAEGFRSATNPFGSGKVQEMMGDFMGITAPNKAFEMGKIFIINKAEEESQTAGSNSVTRLGSFGANWQVFTNWEGPSSSMNFEDLRNLKSDEKYTSMGFITNDILPEATINQAVKGEAYKYLTALALPFIASRSVSTAFGNLLGVATMLKGFEIGMSIDEDFGEGVVCEKKTLDELKAWYIGVTAAGEAIDIALTFGGPALAAKAAASSSSSMLYKMFARSISTKVFTKRTIVDLFHILNPIVAAQMYAGNRAMQYVSSCKDSQYKILAYSDLSEGEIGESTSGTEQLLESIDDLSSQLGIGSAAQSSFEPQTSVSQLEQLKDTLSFKAVLQDQFGAVSPEEIYYLQIEESAWSVQGGLFDQLEGQGCAFNENYAGDGLNFNLGEDGITVYNEDGSVRLSLNDYWNKVRALGRMRSQENARVILPNKIIDHSLDCPGPFIEIDYRANAVLKGSCGDDCLKTAISMVTGREASNDLSDAIGTISSVDTDKGVASFAGDTIRFIVLYPDEDELFGEEVTAPGVEQLGLASRQELQASKLSISVGENGVVSAELSGSGQPKRGIGSVKTIIGDKGKIEFSNGKMLLFVYSLAGTSAQNIRDLTSSLQDGEMNLGVQAKTGAEESGEELNAALDAIQGEGGMDVLETDDHIYYFDGENLRVIDKNTGEATDYAITGREDLGNGQYAFDTDQGQFRFGFDMENGQPMLSAEGPNGLNEVLALLAARGDDGILTFNPSTGAINVYNGQDIPLSPEFASKGISFMGDENGRTRGVPANNPFTANWDTGGTSNRGGLNLPSWPENQLLVALMVSVVLIGVAFVRRD